ncbi:MAG: MarR family winged helix-turn-helix transcriptional regulator [Devosia sp.]|nr:MarR family winged helix-turn-helix transcriptional regulator [Devosia sp.]
MTDIPDPTVITLEKWLPYRLFIIAARVAELLADYYGPRYGLSQAAWRVLAVVGDKPGLNARQIRQAAGLDQYAVSRAIVLLCELDYAERNAADHDRRRAEVHLTETGRSAFKELSRIGLAIEAELLGAVSEKQRAELDRLIADMEKASAGLVARGLRSIVPEAEKHLPDRQVAPTTKNNA